MDLLLVTRSVYPLHGYGGMERHCYDWIHAMASRGCSIHVVTMTPTHAEALSQFAPGVLFYLIPGKPARRVLPRITSYPRWVKQAERFLVRFTAKTPVQAIYAHGLAAAACAGLNAPVYYNPHGLEEFKTGGLKRLAYARFRALSRRGAACARRVIATDRSLVPEIIRFLKVPEDRIALIPNAVRLDSTGSSSPLVPVSGDPLFLAAGRLEANKGFHVLLAALARTQQLPPGWKLVLAGAGSQEDRLKKLAQQEGLRGRISFAGTIGESDLKALYARADLFLNPTLFEGSSIVTLEAMNAGLPVVASNAGGLPDKIIPGRNGWLVPPGNPEALAQAIEEACARRSEWKDMGAASKKIVDEKYSWETAADRFLALFENR